MHTHLQRRRVQEVPRAVDVEGHVPARVLAQQVHIRHLCHYAMVTPKRPLCALQQHSAAQGVAMAVHSYPHTPTQTPTPTRPPHDRAAQGVAMAVDLLVAAGHEERHVTLPEPRQRYLRVLRPAHRLRHRRHDAPQHLGLYVDAYTL